MSSIKTIDGKLKALQRELKKVQRDLFTYKTKHKQAAGDAISKWKSLRKKITAKWNGISVLEEIRYQRSRVW